MNFEINSLELRNGTHTAKVDILFGDGDFQFNIYTESESAELVRLVIEDGKIKFSRITSDKEPSELIVGPADEYEDKREQEIISLRGEIDLNKYQ